MARARHCKNTTSKPLRDPKHDSHRYFQISLDAVTAVLTANETTLGQRWSFAQELRVCTRVRVWLRVCAHVSVHGPAGTRLGARGCTYVVGTHRCAHVHTRVWMRTSVRMHGSGGVAPQPCPPTLKPGEGNRQFSCGCNPCTYNAREGIIPGINILNSLTRPTASKILRPVNHITVSGITAFLASNLSFRRSRWELPPNPCAPQTPQGWGRSRCVWVFLLFFSHSLRFPCRGWEKTLSCRLPPPNSQ